MQVNSILLISLLMFSNINVVCNFCFYISSTKTSLFNFSYDSSWNYFHFSSFHCCHVQHSVTCEEWRRDMSQLLVCCAAGLTEPLSCVAHGWDRIIPIAVGSRILILGAGIIGNLWASILHLQGHRRVTVSEPQEARRKMLEKLGLYD
jgi:threonine dehydrogenase-like Zn-dependent dehydrogenase